MSQLIETNGIRRFTDANIQLQIDRALAELPADRKLAVVAHASRFGDTTTGSLSIVTRLGEKWSIAAGCYKSTGKPFTGEGKVVWSPF